MPLSIGGDDVDGVTLTLRSGLSVRGRVELEGSADRPKTAAFSPYVFALDTIEGPPAPQRPPTVEWEKSGDNLVGNFRVSGFPNGKYLFRVVGSPVGWMFKSATSNGV